jgi:hypothetical protein
MGGEKMAMLAYFQERSSPYLINQENQSQKPALQTEETRMPYPIVKTFLQGIRDSRVIPPDPVKNSSMKKNALSPSLNPENEKGVDKAQRNLKR